MTTQGREFVFQIEEEAQANRNKIGPILLGSVKEVHGALRRYKQECHLA